MDCILCDIPTGSEYELFYFYCLDEYGGDDGCFRRATERGLLNEEDD